MSSSTQHCGYQLTSNSIVIVHGLQGHPYKTWACKYSNRDGPSKTNPSNNISENGNGNRKPYHGVVPWLFGRFSDSSSIRPSPDLKGRDDGRAKSAQVFWPRDLLPVQYPNARILLYGYDTRVTNYLAGSTNETSIHSHGKDLLYSLATSRKLDRPLLLIAHSLGGIVVKEMLASSSNSPEHILENVVASTIAVIFLGTPHRGSPDLALIGDRARSMISALRMRTNPEILDALRLKTRDLERAQDSFSAVWSRYDFRVKTFQEGLGLTGLNFGPFGRKVVPDDSSLLGDVRERAERIQANHMDMCRFTGPDDPNYGRICGEITSIYDRLVGHNTTIAHQVESQYFTPRNLATSPLKSRAGAMGQREMICLQSLSFPNMNQRTQNLKSPAEGTCSWFFKHEAFVEWLNNRNQTQSCGLLWLSGKPGSGKSTLLKEALYRAMTDMGGSEGHVASFFFNAKGDDLEHSPTGMLRSIIHQMCSQDASLLAPLMEFAQSRRVLRGEDRAPWDEAELRAFLKSAIIAHRKKMIIFIDAIDECDSSSVRDMADFWRETTMIAHRADVRLSVCLSSRYFPTISVKDCPEIIMEAHNHADIVNFVRRRLDLGMTGKYADQQAIQDKILEKSDGVFLWVSLVVKDILRKHDEGKGLRYLLKHLDSVPRELEDLFHQLLSTEPSSTMVVRMFHWALLPTKPLRLHEWHHILAFIGDAVPSSLHQWRQSDVYTETDEQLEKRITHLSRGLLSFNVSNSNGHEPSDDFRSDRAGAGSLDLNTGESRVVQVIHESVRQYFMEGPGFAVLNPAFADKPLAHAHLSMMSVCLNYILIDELDALVEARFQAQRRTQYGLITNGTPARPDRPESVASFGSASSHNGRMTPVELRRQHREKEGSFSGSSARSLLGETLPLMPPSRGMDNDPPLRILKQSSGSAEGYQFANSWLKEQSAAEQAHFDETAASPSTQASVTGYSQILEDHPALLSYATSEFLTHARKADEEDLDPGDVIRLFLRTDTWRRWKVLREDIDEQIELLYFAADLGLCSWVKTRGIWEESEIMSSIEFAIGNNNTEALSMLLDAFLWTGYAKDVSSRIISTLVSAPHHGTAALLDAYLSGHPSQRHSSRDCTMAVKDMLSSKDEAGRTALHLAIVHQNAPGVSVFLKNGADVSTVDPMLSTPLHLACMNQLMPTRMPSSDKSNSVEILTPSINIIGLLLNHHAQVDALDVHGRTPLFVACSNITLSPGKGTRGYYPSDEVRFDRGHPIVIDLLLSHRADVTMRNSMGLLPIHEACRTSSSGRQSMVYIVSKLLDHGSPVNAEGDGGRTPLHFACYCPDHQLVEELLRRGADPLSRDHHGRTALHIATARSTEQVVKVLLSFPGMLVDATDDSRSTPLHVACDPRLISNQDESTRLASIRQLLARGAKAHTICNEDGDSPFDVARKFNFEEAMEMLAEESCDGPVREMTVKIT